MRGHLAAPPKPSTRGHTEVRCRTHPVRPSPKMPRRPCPRPPQEHRSSFSDLPVGYGTRDQSCAFVLGQPAAERSSLRPDPVMRILSKTVISGLVSVIICRVKSMSITLASQAGQVGTLLRRLPTTSPRTRAVWGDTSQNSSLRQSDSVMRTPAAAAQVASGCRGGWLRTSD